jgi:arsenical pump membrane protein
LEQAIAFSTVALTVTLAVSRPRMKPFAWRITPGAAAVFGVLVLMLARLIRVEDLLVALRIQWRPLVSLFCIMVMTGVVEEVGAFERLAARLEAYGRRTSAARAFSLVFAVSIVTPSLLNNDSAVLLLTPLAVALARRLYPGQPGMVEAFAFAVFLAPGVAPLFISNPMNMIVAGYAGIGFNAYAAIMVPISLAGALATWLILRWRFRHALSTARADARPVAIPAPRRAERPALLLLAAVFIAYPVAAALHVQIWTVTLAGALGSFAVARGLEVAPAKKLVGHVSFDIIVFLWGVFVVVAGLRNAGLTAHLSALFRLVPDGSAAQIGLVGSTAALGSALVDNHPMSMLNMLALGSNGQSRALLAALVGGDIGPRLLPIGSLAGLLWMDLVRRANVTITVGRFVRLGALVLVPTLALSLAMLALHGP